MKSARQNRLWSAPASRFLCGFFACLLITTLAGRADQRPNFLLVISDDHDYEHFGFAGHPIARTPTIDRLAETGAVFPVAHMAMSRCHLSLASLLSGRYPHQTGIYYNYGPGKLSGDRSLPNLLKEAGYATFAQGKYWEGDPARMGFTHGPGRDYDFVRRDQDAVLEFLDNVADRPFFIWYAPRIPHTPHNPPARYRKLFAERSIPIPPWLRGDPVEFRKKEALSLAMEAWLDDGLSVVLNKLHQRRLDESTIVIFLIDNGWCNGLVSKGSPYEKGLRTPVIFTCPGRISAGRRPGQLVSSVDIMPTVLDYAGIPIPESCAGKSLRPVIDGREEKLRDALFGAVYPAFATEGDARPERDIYALHARTERWKYVLYLQDVREKRNRDYFRIQHILTDYPARDRGHQELFDLQNDPYELENLAADAAHRRRLERLRKGSLAWWKRTGGKKLNVPEP